MTSVDGGPIHWPAPVARQLVIDGMLVEALLDTLAFTGGDSPQELVMADKSTVEQSLFNGYGVPLDLRRDTIELSIPVMVDTDLRALRGMEARGRSVPVWTEEPRMDEWIAAPGPDGVLGATAWSTSRVLAQGSVTGVDLASHPVAAWLDDVEQEVVTAAPGAGQVQLVIGAGAQNRAVVTPTVAPGRRLRLYYYPLLYCKVQGKRLLSAPNAYDWQGTLVEMLPADWR